MALDTRLAAAQRSRAVDAVSARLNGGKLRIYSGTRPATADTALSGNTLLAELTFGSPAFGAAASGVATANAITQDAAADATGTHTFARCVESDGTTPVLDMETGTSGANVNLNSATIAGGAPVSVTSMTLTLPAQGA